ncbi:MAG: molybdate ABC transporter substrate-binding protein [Pseudomonadales bacterium]|jgi:molybdate transport system substrate-binding protein|nr:molybdate ABC transporter substrate-binding protein [Pseudomonadales bacterium]
MTFLSRLALSFVFSGMALVAQAEQIHVAVASNFSDTLAELGQLFQAATGHELVLSPGASGTIYTQITHGAPFDVFFSADEALPQRLLQEGLASQTGLYARGALVLWSQNPALVDADGTVLRNGNFRHLAFANPALAPYGVAAQETLTALGLWQELQGKLVQGENITQTLQFIASGNAELGFIAASQYVALAGHGSAWAVPAALYTPIRQSYALLQDNPASRALLAFLNTSAAQALLERSGYLLPP